VSEIAEAGVVFPRRYDVAISYAGEDETLAKAIYRHLRARDVNAFFAPARTSYLWGKDDREFERIYGPGSRFVMPLISADYARKEWTRLEFRAARREARNRKQESILPVRVDNTPLPGLRKKTVFLDSRRHSAKQIAAFLIEKLEAGLRAPRTARREAGSAVVLGDEDREMLGLLATAAFPLSTAQLRELMPAAGWERHIPRWKRLNLITRDSGGAWSLEPRLQGRLTGDRSAVSRWRERWVALLEPLRAHMDTGLFFALELVAVGRVGEAVAAIASIAGRLEPGYWLGLYLAVFTELNQSPLMKTASVKSRIEFHNAYGVLLSQSGDHGNALRQFMRLRRLSRRTHNVWGEGQSYINAGVAESEAGSVPAAMAWYSRASAFGKKHRDYVLAGRAVGNMANFVEPEAATKLLDESELLKTRGLDLEGLAGAAVTRGNVAVQNGDFAGAAKHYRRAITLAKKLDLRHLQVRALRNLALTEVDRGRPEKAYLPLRESARICHEEGFKADQADSIAGEALARMASGELARAGRLYQVLSELCRKSGWLERAAVAQHDIGVTLAERGRRDDAYRVLKQALQEFRAVRSRRWVLRTQMDMSVVAPDDPSAVSILARARRAAVMTKDFVSLKRSTEELVKRRLSRGDIDEAVRELDRALGVLPSPLDLPLRVERFHLLVGTRNDRRIGPAFRRLVAAARMANEPGHVIDAQMEAGDYLWAKGEKRERANAYQLYCAAMFEALPDMSTFSKISAHITGRLLGVARKKDSSELDRLEGTTRSWLRNEDPRHAESVIPVTLWPLRLAARLNTLPHRGRRLPKPALQDLIVDELQRGFDGFAGARKKGRGPRPKAVARRKGPATMVRRLVEARSPAGRARGRVL
jgi:tetratricopeptide (TPR) repeat protein